MSTATLLIILLVGLIAGWLAGQIVQGTGFGLVAIHAHPVAGKDAKSEAGLVYGLTDLFSVPAALLDAAFSKQQISELNDKAAKMREEAQKKEAKGEGPA
jgi:hypothetical protein